MRGNFSRAFLGGLLSMSLAVPIGLGGAGAAFASAADGERFWSLPTTAQTIDYQSILKTYGVTSGAAGADFLGITNTNYDFAGADPSQYATSQYGDYSYNDLGGVEGAGLGVWGTAVNESPNLFYTNLMYNAGVRGTSNKKATVAATTWAATPSPINNWDDSSWGDSLGASSANAEGAGTVNGLEYSPEIIYGANKLSGWSDFSYENTYIYKALSKNSSNSYSPKFVNADATNAWTQMYSLTKLADAAEDLKAKAAQRGQKLTTRYDDNNALVGALSYEKSVRGNLLYIASKLDKGHKKKKVAYLYQLKSGAGTFLVAHADGLVNGNDTGDGTVYDDRDSNGYLTGYETKAQAKVSNHGMALYASNNALIDYDYLGVLPFITDTFDKGVTDDSELKGIDLRIGDIWKTCPTVSVNSDDRSDDPLKDVDVIIYNSDSSKCPGGADVVRSWASTYGFDSDKGIVIAGSDYGNSTNQGYGTADADEAGMAPLLCNQRDFSADKLARMAWSFAQVYPELYDGNADATYAYWVDKVYHVKTASVPAVVQYMTNQSDDVTYGEKTAESLEQDFKEGIKWWKSTGSKSAAWNKYAYYTGSSRASYYSGKASSEEPENTIGIMQPSAELLASEEPKSISKAHLKLSKTKYVYDGKAKRPAVSVTGADGRALAAGTDYTVSYSRNLNAGTAKVTVSGKGSWAGSAAKTFTIAKAANTLKAAGKTVKVKAGSLKKRSVSVRAVTVSKQRGAVSYKKLSGSKRISINLKSGKLSIKKKTKKGTYKLKVGVMAKGTANYKSGSKTVSVKVKVR